MTDSWGPLERRRYLDSLDGNGSNIFADVADAERLAEVCERDWSEAVAALRNARVDAPDADLAASRALSPVERHRLVQLYQAQEGEQRAADAYHRARMQLNRALDLLDQLARPDLGLPPGPER